MSRVAIVTDSNSGITQQEAKELGIYVLPMPFYINEELYFEDISLTQEEFYRMLAEDGDIHTSQPSPSDVMDLWEGLLEEYDEVVHIPMSSGLSGSCETAMMLAQEYKGRVQVVNNQRISVTQRQSVLEAKELAENGKTACEIREILELHRLDSSIYIMVDTLKYLKKGGRVTPAGAALGTLLRIKPVLEIQGEKLDAFAKARSMKQAKALMVNAILKDIESRFGGNLPAQPVRIMLAHTMNQEEAENWREELAAVFPGYDILINPLSLSVACHIGPGSIAIACTKYLPELA